MVSMIKRTVSFRPDQVEAMKRLSKAAGVSFNRIVRECVHRRMDEILRSAEAFEKTNTKWSGKEPGT